MKIKNEINKIILELPLSTNALKDTIIDLNKNVQEQLKKDLTILTLTMREELLTRRA